MDSHASDRGENVCVYRTGGAEPLPYEANADDAPIRAARCGHRALRIGHR